MPEVTSLELIYEGKDRVRVAKVTTFPTGSFTRQSFVVSYDEVEDQISKLHTARMSEAAAMFHLPWSINEELPRLLPWAVHLPDDERVEMLRELAEALENSPATWVQCLLEWQRTAEVYADPALRSSLVDRVPDTGCTLRKQPITNEETNDHH
jgi:hypothetical protein